MRRSIVLFCLMGCAAGHGPSARAQPAQVDEAHQSALVVLSEVDAGVSDGGGVTRPRFTKVVVGAQHACALSTNADVYCWGRVGFSGDEGDVGLDTYAPRRMEGLSDIIDVDIATASTCVLRRDRELRCRFVGWPMAAFGEDGPLEWVPMGTVPHAVSIALSGNAVCALDAAGAVFCGDATVQVSELSSLAHVARLYGDKSLYGSSFCAITGDLHASCFGEGNPAAPAAKASRPMRPVPVYRPLDRSPVEIPGLSGIEQLTWWDDDVCARRTDGSFVCRGSTKAVDEKRLALVGVGATLLSGAGPHCALSRDGHLHCWNGDGTTKRRLDLDVELLTPEAIGTVTSAAVGDRHACVLRGDGEVACWGGTHLGATGTGVLLSRHVPVRVELPEAAQVTASYDDSCARLTDGSVRCWGFSVERRKAATGPTCEPTVDSREPRCPTPIEVLGPGEAAEIAGTEPLCVRARAGGPFRCKNGQPRVFRDLTGIAGGSTSIAALAPYGYGQSARTNTGRLLGSKDFLVGSQSGATLPAFAPLPWAAKASWKRVTADGRCGIDEQDRVRCACVEDDFGRRADSCGPKDLTFPFPALAGARELIHLPNNDVCASFTDGHVACAREIALPEDLAKGRVVVAADQAGIARLSGVVALRGSQMFESGGVSRGPVRAGFGGTACAITREGAVFCWGASARGEVGDPARPASTSTPHKVEGLPAVQDVALGEHHACALTRVGQVFCWGDDEKGQLGQGTPARVTAPTPVKL